MCLYVSLCVFIWECACPCMFLTCGTHEGLKRSLDPMYVVLSYLMWVLGTQLWFCKFSTHF